MIATFIVAAALLIQSGPASSVVPAASNATTVSPAIVKGKRPASSTLDPQEVICRSEPVLGTMFPKKICATRQELTERRQLDQKETREATNLRPYKLTDGIGP